MMAKKPTIAAVILAGGQATRMDGVDKGLVLLNGEPLVSHVLKTLSKQVDEVLISANRNQHDYASFGVRAIADSISDFPGPLAGMAAAMEAVDTDLLFVCPCDSPFISHDIVERLCVELTAKQADIAVANDGERPQPVFALLRCALLPSLLDCLNSGERKIMFWYRQQKLVNVDFSDQTDVFININTPQERDDAERRLQSCQTNPE